MKNNHNELFNQFVSAKGIINPDKNSKQLMKEFFEWIEDRKAIGKKYIDNLSNMRLFKNNSTFAEVNKGIDDAVTLDFNTKLVTPYLNTEMVSNPTRVIDGDFYINKNQNIPIVTNETVKIRVLSRGDITTYMTQNPYSQDMLDGWSELHNSGRSNIIVGIYGNYNDKDRQEKIEMLQRFKRKLTGDFKESGYALGDEYFYVISSIDNKSRKRNR